MNPRLRIGQMARSKAGVCLGKILAVNKIGDSLVYHIATGNPKEAYFREDELLPSQK